MIIIIIVVTAVILVCSKSFVVKCTAVHCQVIKKTSLVLGKIALYSLIRNAFRRKISRFHEFSLENYMHFLFLKKLIICISFKSKRQLSVTKKTKAILTAASFKHTNIRHLKITYKCVGNLHF